MKQTVLLCVLVIFNVGCIYDYTVKPDYYLETAGTFSAEIPPAEAALPDTVDLKTCIGMVLAHNPGIERARSDSRMAEYGVDIARSYIIPKVKLEAVNTYSDNDVYAAYGWDEKTFFLAKLSAQYLIYDFGISRYMINQRYRDTDAARAGIRVMSDSLAFGAAQLFFTVKAMEEDISSMEESIRSLEAQVGNVDSMFREGMIPESQLLTLQVALENLRYGKTSLENARYKTLLKLKSMMEYPADRELKLEAGSDSLSSDSIPSEDILVETALRKRPEITAARAAIDSAGMGLKASRAKRWPLFLIGAELGYSDLEKIYGYGGVNTQVALTMSWDVFTGGEKEAGVAIEREKLRKARLSLREAETSVREEVRAAVSDIRTLSQQKRSLNLALESAQRNLQDIQLLYKNQKATSSDLVEAQSSLLTARSNMTKAQYSLLTAMYALEKSIGVSLGSLKPVTPETEPEPETEQPEE